MSSGSYFGRCPTGGNYVSAIVLRSPSQETTLGNITDHGSGLNTNTCNIGNDDNFLLEPPCISENIFLEVGGVSNKGGSVLLDKPPVEPSLRRKKEVKRLRATVVLGSFENGPTLRIPLRMVELPLRSDL